MAGKNLPGATREEAVANIREAIRDWLEVAAEIAGVRRYEIAEVAV